MITIVPRLRFFVLHEESGQTVLAALHGRDAEKYGEEDEITKKTSGSSQLQFEPIKLLNFYSNADADPPFHIFADPDPASKNSVVDPDSFIPDPGTQSLNVCLSGWRALGSKM